MRCAPPKNGCHQAETTVSALKLASVKYLDTMKRESGVANIACAGSADSLVPHEREGAKKSYVNGTLRTTRPFREGQQRTRLSALPAQGALRFCKVQTPTHIKKSDIIRSKPACQTRIMLIILAILGHYWFALRCRAVAFAIGGVTVTGVASKDTKLLPGLLIK